jgi:hypothetical protein
MECERCGSLIEPGEEREHCGQVLCEDCYMDRLSPPRTCDPWAVHTARSFKGGADDMLTEVQLRLLNLLRDSGGLTPRALAEQLGLTPSELEREVAALRHMEKLRARLRDGVKVLTLWDAEG